MRILIHPGTHKNKVAISFEAENEAEKHQLQYMKLELDMGNAEVIPWKDSECGREGITVLVPKKEVRYADSTTGA